MTDKGNDPVTYYLLDMSTRSVVPMDDDGSGDPPVVQWARYTHGYRRVAWDDVPDMGLHVSTIFTGFDFVHSFGLRPEPLLFETAVIDDERQIHAQWLCPTIDAAEAAHAAALAELRAGVRP